MNLEFRYIANESAESWNETFASDSCLAENKTQK